MKAKSNYFSLLIIFLSLFSFDLFARELTKEEINAVETGVNKLLKDPYSAKYTHDDYMFDGHRGGAYCGKVNAKNSYGAYIGYRLFAVVFIETKSEGLLAAPIGNMDDNQEAISSLCASSGYNLRVNKIFKDDVNKERVQKGFDKLDNAYFY